MNKNRLMFFLIGALSIAIVAVTGCDSKGPAEKAGEKVDQSVESVKDAVEDMGDKISGKGPAEKMGETIDEAIDDVEETVKSKNN